MSMLCTLPRPACLAYAVRWSNPWEKYPRNRQTPLGSGACHIRSEDQLIGCKISLPQSDRLLQALWRAQGTCALSHAASGPTGGNFVSDTIDETKRAARLQAMIEYNRKNKDKIKEKRREYLKKNKEKLGEQRREYRRKHPEMRRKEYKLRKERDSDLYRVQRKRSDLRRRYRILGLDLAYVEKLLRAATVCHWCKKRFFQSECRTIDHVIPIARGGHSSPSNIVIACRSCNSRKQHGNFNPVSGQGILL